MKEKENVNERVFLEELVNFQFNCIVWDLDETLGDTQRVVKAEFDRLMGTDYSLRTIDRFDALSFWAFEDGVATYEAANTVETRLWTDSRVLSKVSPIPELQDFSRKTAGRGKTQYIVTSRNNQLKVVTKLWARQHFPWIPSSKVRITPRRDVLYDSKYKKKVIATIKPDFVFEDNVNHVSEILESTPASTRIIWLSRELETNNLKSERVLVLPGGPKQFSQLMSHNIDI